jgi:ABC-type nitrate/sulfonate/bicarbonate transport system permease component
MSVKKNRFKKIYYFLLAYLILWVVLFEFILPVNNILPKPSIVIQSFGALWLDYNLPINFLSTVTVIYISLTISYFILKWVSVFLAKGSNPVSDFILSLEWFSEYIPGIIFGFLLIYWFPDSEIIEFVFAFGTAFSSLVIKFQKESGKVSKEFIDAAESLGVSGELLIKEVKWKAIQPEVMKHIFYLHFYIWTLLIVFEFIKGGYGLGSIFKSALEFNDISALFSIIVITGLTVYLGNSILKYLRNKFFFWSVV